MQYDYSDEVVCGAWGVQENVERGNWESKPDFIMASIGFLIGFGNLIAFPMECFKFGGGRSLSFLNYILQPDAIHLQITCNNCRATVKIKIC